MTTLEKFRQAADRYQQFAGDWIPGTAGGRFGRLTDSCDASWESKAARACVYADGKTGLYGALRSMAEGHLWAVELGKSREVRTYGADRNTSTTIHLRLVFHQTAAQEAGWQGGTMYRRAATDDDLAELTVELNRLSDLMWKARREQRAARKAA